MPQLLEFLILLYLVENYPFPCTPQFLKMLILLFWGAFLPSTMLLT